MTGAAEYHRGSKALIRARLAPARRISTPSALAGTWNRIGGMFERLSRTSGIAPAAALALWMVECGGLPFRRGRPVLRFENHIFFRHWGKDNEALFNLHFQFGGHAGVEGRSWEQHRFRLSADAEWRRFHGDQSTEYLAFDLAARLSSREVACLSASLGGPQIMGFNHGLIGYASAHEMFQAFARSERWQVLGFFDFCKAKNLGGPIASRDWPGFASVYNGPGNAAAYAAKIAAAFAEASDALA